MTILHAGGEMGAFTPFDGNCVEDSTFGFDATYARCALKISGDVSGATSTTFSSAATFWLHARWSVDQSDVGVWALQFRSSSTNVMVAKMTNTGFSGGMDIEFFTLQSGALTSVGEITFDYGVEHTLDINLVAGGSGSLTVYVNGTERLSGTGLDHSGFAGVTSYVLRGGRTVIGDAWWSECIASTTSMIGRRLKTIPATGNSATNTAWTGAYTEIDEIVYSDADKIVSTAANDVETFTSTATLTGLVEAIVATARANCGATGPQNLQLALRVSGSNYFSSSIALSAGLTANVGIWETNPDTSAAWGSSPSTPEFGVKAIA